MRETLKTPPEMAQSLTRKWLKGVRVEDTSTCMYVFVCVFEQVDGCRMGKTDARGVRLRWRALSCKARRAAPQRQQASRRDDDDDDDAPQQHTP